MREIKDEVLRMGSLVASQIGLALDSLVSHDPDKAIMKQASAYAAAGKALKGMSGDAKEAAKNAKDLDSATAGTGDGVSAYDRLKGAVSELADKTGDADSRTRALREASSERRRKIGSAIAASGLAANAINSLTGEGRDQTYSAFSVLFLMAKAGEVQPLMQAVAKHPNTEVRLTSVKLLALSNQHQVLPGLRSLAARDALPAEVHTAVMEAIYLLSNQTQEVA
jgi:hypothetical protein